MDRSPDGIYALAAEADDRDNMEIFVRLPEQVSYDRLLSDYKIPLLLSREFFRLAEENRALKAKEPIWQAHIERAYAELNEQLARGAALEAEMERLREQLDGGRRLAEEIKEMLLRNDNSG